MRFEVDLLKEKTNVADDPDFKVIKEADIIDLDKLEEEEQDADGSKAPKESETALAFQPEGTIENMQLADAENEAPNVSINAAS